jgi:hypothetical protein
MRSSELRQPFAENVNGACVAQTMALACANLELSSSRARVARFDRAQIGRVFRRTIVRRRSPPAVIGAVAAKCGDALSAQHRSHTHSRPAQVTAGMPYIKPPRGGTHSAEALTGIRSMAAPATRTARVGLFIAITPHDVNIESVEMGVGPAVTILRLFTR